MHAGRTIGEHCGGDAEACDGDSLAGSTGDATRLMAEHGARAYEARIAVTHEELCFLLQRHGMEHFVDIVGTELGSCLSRCRCCKCEGSA